MIRKNIYIPDPTFLAMHKICTDLEAKRAKFHLVADGNNITKRAAWTYSAYATKGIELLNAIMEGDHQRAREVIHSIDPRILTEKGLG